MPKPGPGRDAYPSDIFNIHSALLERCAKLKYSGTITGFPIIETINSDISESYLNIKTGEICTYTDEEIRDAEENRDLSESPEWYRTAVAKAKQFIENQDDYLPLPQKYDLNEYRIMEKFISRVPVEEQSDILFQAIKGKGAFRRFRISLDRFALLEQWYGFKEKKLREFAESWCKDNEIEFT